jgi:Rrf2 family protein
MLNQTSEIAIKALIFIGLMNGEQPLSPRTIARAIDCSPTYLAKTLRLLVRPGILRSQRGARGGVGLGRAPDEISLLHIVEACQGLIVSDYCQPVASANLPKTCAFHRAMQEIHEMTVNTLSRWTLAHLLQCPMPVEDSGLSVCQCKVGDVAFQARRLQNKVAAQ